MEEHTAVEVIRRAMNITADLDDLVRLAKEAGMEDAEFQVFRRTVGRAMGEIYVELLMPLFSQFPHLAPTELTPPPG